jgi:hypothetical protein
MKAIEKARKQEQMSTDGQSMASTVPFTPEDGSWLLAVSEEQPEAGAGLTGTQVGG